MRRSLLSVLCLLFSAAVAEPQTPDTKLLERARVLLEAAPLIDTHNDLPTMLLEKYGRDLTRVDLGKVQPDQCADVRRLREGRVGAQFWSVWADSATMQTHTATREALREFDVALRFIRSRPELEPATTADDIERIRRAGRIAALIGVEGRHMIERQQMQRKRLRCGERSISTAFVPAEAFLFLPIYDRI